MAQAERILVVGPAWVGDMVMAQSLFITLRAEHPGASIDVLAPAWSKPILARMPEVDEAVTLPAGHGELGLGARWRLGRSLRTRDYARAIVIPRSLKAALVPWFARIPRRTGYRGEFRYGVLNDIRPLDKTVLTQTVQRYVALGRPRDAVLPPPVPRPHLRIDEVNRTRQLHALGLELDRPVVALMPGAEYGPAKRWPPASFSRVAQGLAESGYRIWLLGSEKDRAIAETIRAPVGDAAVNLCGRTRLEDAIDLLSLARAALTNDSGLMHVAAAVGIPLVAIYGSSTPAYTPPLSERARAVYLGLECSPCFERTCPLGHLNCLRQITPERILTEVEQLLGRKAADSLQRTDQ
ncbi:MAG: lipopolysaccharide heptosyltransferase II [Gammaproteobacteria bacterium]